MPEAKKETPKILSKNVFPVIVIGASAGGLKALSELVAVKDRIY